MIFKISDISKNITNDSVGDQIYSKITELLKTEENITLDFSDVNVITTYCAKQIFKKLLNELGEEEFNSKILFSNITSTIETEINLGLNDI